MCFKWFFWRKKEAALDEAKKLEKEKVPGTKEIKEENQKLTKEEKELKRVFSELQTTKANARKTGKKSKKVKVKKRK